VGPIFCTFLTDPPEGSDCVYEEVTNYPKVRAVVEEKLEDYNMEPKLIPMDLSMFRDAIMHVCRIHRVLMQPRGNMMLVGVGGSGRSSLTRLSAYMAGMITFSIEITKNYRLLEFREDIKKLYLSAGGENKRVVFLFNDTQIKDEGFLEDVNNILSSGVLPNLFAKDEMPAILDAVRKAAIQQGREETPDALWAFFIDRVRANLHVVLAMSPIGDSLRNRCRMYPGLVNCTTIDWFHTWPAEALQEVAMKFLAQVEFAVEDYRQKISAVFAEMHLSVITSSARMLLELRRYNYVTPTNYLELVKGYRALLGEKSTELGSSANKLANGLAKLENAREQVATLSKELEVKKVIVAHSQKECEDLLVQIVGERRVADEQRKQVEADSERISLEAAECKAISDDAEADLAIAMPALEKAMEEVEKLDKGSISEVKAYTKPPALVETVLQGVMILFQKPIDWPNAKKVIGESNFLQQIKQFDKDHVSASTNNKIKKYIDMPEFKPEKVRAVSGAAAALCVWVHAIYIYANVAKEVAPKRQRLKEATDSLATKQAALKEATDALAAVTAKLADLQTMYDNSNGEKNRLRDEAENLERKLDRAGKLVNGLAGEYTRWQASIGEYNSALVKVTGDALVAAAFLSYAGPFETSYRITLMSQWSASVNAYKLPISPGFSFVAFLGKPTDVRDWNIQGLPKDDFSTENGVISTRGRRWPLMIDPQGQANRWIRNMEGSKLRIIDLKMSGFLREVENAVQYGFPVLLQDILEEIDPALEPVLSKSVLKIGNREVLRLGDKELDYSPDFKLYITTKLANPHYTPEISTKATVVNFAVKKDGLEAQLLGIVVQKEEPTLEKQKSELTIRVATGKRQLVDLEDEILRLLSETKGSLLDDEGLVNTLQQSKVTSEAVTAQLAEAEITEKKIDLARMGYRSAAIRASLAYFVLDDMSRVDPMYQFSLDSYVDLFNLSIDNSRYGSLDLPVAKRCEDINAEHTLSVYKYTCRGLFEKDKLLFSLQLCLKVLETQGSINQEEFNFFSFGAGMTDRALQRKNPAEDWLPPVAWDNICEMDKLQGFQGIVSGFEQMLREWKGWYMSSKPEVEPMPGDWSVRSTELQKLCILKALRVDRCLFGAARFISANMGSEYVEPPSFNLKEVYESSNCKTPLIFVLSPGVDPTAGIFQLAGQINQKVDNCALGQGQAPTAVRMIEEGVHQGNWVFLANCHLMLSWMPTLEKMIESLIEGTPHPKFRLWLSSSPDPNFPIAILQRGIKMTTEPPKGLRSNLLTLYNTISDEQFGRCGHQSAYKRLLFALVWFHAILLERRKFKSMGFNIPYDFNESDFAICHDLIIVFLDEYPDRVPFDAMKYLIAEANYGGRVTDDWDRRLVNVYIGQKSSQYHHHHHILVVVVCMYLSFKLAFTACMYLHFPGELISEDCISMEKFMLSDLPDYYIGEEGDLKHYKELIKGMPPTDHPLAFGQHPNSDMAASIDDANNMIDTLVSLQPRVVKAVDEQEVDPIAAQCSELLQQTAEVFVMRTVKEKLDSRSDPDPLKTVLYQELDRYNKLLGTLHHTLSTIVKVTQGTASITPELEEVMIALSQLKVPKLWGKTYPSLKPLGSWMRDLSLRVDFFTGWVDDKLPICWWLPAMTYPTGFLTAVLQVAARLNGVSIDSLSYETPVTVSGDKASVSNYPKDGVYVSGVFIEGATWNYTGGFLEESRPMELVSAMPIIHFKPAEGRRRAAKGFYTCPLYMYPVRSGSRERPSYVVSVDLRGGKFSSDFWTKRGVAMLLSTAM
jgi:dynein heavy chain